MPVMKTLCKTVFFCVLCVYAIQIDSTWENGIQFKGLITDKCLLDIAYGITLIGCASKCLIHENCKSFFFNKGSQTCYHHATKFERNPSENNTYMVSQPGTVYFYNTGEKDLNISTSTHIVCAAAKCAEFTYLPAINRYFKIAQYSTGSWENATEQCHRNGGRLATSKDQSTIDALKWMIHNSMRGFENLKGFWLSAKLNANVNEFVWSDDNKTVLPHLWHPGKPEYFTNTGTKTECVVLVPLYDFKLADYRCNVTGDSIIPLCECK